MKVIAPFGKKESKGTFDDFFSTEKYSSIKEAYENNDYVHADYVTDEDGTLFIEAHNSQKPEVKKQYKLNFQNCPFGIDVFDDSSAANMASTLLEN